MPKYVKRQSKEMVSSEKAYFDGNFGIFLGEKMRKTKSDPFLL